MTPRSEYRLRRRVQFSEVDSAGIVHFSCYFRYLEEAEHALWREAGISIAPPGRTVGFPRVSASFDYHAPLRFEDEFDILIRVTAIADKSISYTCDITRGDERIATGAVTVVCVTARPGEPMKAVSIPAEIRSRFAAAPGTPA